MMLSFVIILQLRPNLPQKLSSLLPTSYPNNLFPRVQNQTVDYVLTEWIPWGKNYYTCLGHFFIPNQQSTARHGAPLLSPVHL